VGTNVFAPLEGAPSLATIFDIFKQKYGRYGTTDEALSLMDDIARTAFGETDYRVFDRAAEVYDKTSSGLALFRLFYRDLFCASVSYDSLVDQLYINLAK